MAQKIVIGCLLLVLLGHTESSPYSAAQQIFRLEELVPYRPEFYPDKLSVQWISATEYVYRDPGVGILRYNAATGTLDTLLDDYRVTGFAVTSFSSDGQYLLLASNRKKVYRYSSTAEYSVYDIKNKFMLNLGHGPLQVAVWGGRSLAYVQNNNVVYVPDATRPEIEYKLTTRGIPGEVYFGAADWIYEEEVFNAAEALWFSPSGSYIAVAKFNDTNVESAVYPLYGPPLDLANQYPEMVKFKYPKVGRTNPEVGLLVFKLNDLKSEPWLIPAPVDVVGLDYILGRVNWASDQNLVVLWLNRRQNNSVLVNCDLQQDKCSIVNQRTESNGWIDINEPLFNVSGKKMLEIAPLYYGDQRFLHIARFDFTTLTTEDLTPGNSTVTEVVGWNQEKDIVYYIVSPSETPWLRQLWATSGGETRCVSCKEFSCHSVEANFAEGADYGVISCTATNVPPTTFLYSSKEDSFKVLNDNGRLCDKLSRYKLPMALFNRISLGEDVMANIKLLLPPDMKPDKKYPMIVRVYAGPGTARVKDNYDLEYYNLYLTANRSFIVASIDVRGSGVMGVEAMHAVNTALGTVEITDTLAAIRQLVTIYKFIDPKKVGVWGWSYGGYATTMMLIQDDKHTVACGAAVAPVTSWLYYDSIYTERYMDLPQANPTGYHRSDLTVSAESLRDKRYLLVHGTGDDNVHYQHSMQLAKELQHADIAFEQMSYADENHSLMGVNRHFYHTLDRFWTECFHL